MREDKLRYYTYILAFLFLFFGGLYYAKNLLIPLSLGIFFATLSYPVAHKLEKFGLSRIWASVLCIIGLFVLLGAFIFFFAVQIVNFANTLPEKEEQLKGRLQAVKTFFNETLRLDLSQYVDNAGSLIQEYSSTLFSYASGLVLGTVGGIIGVIVVMVYVFLLLYYRTIFFNFILRLSSDNEKAAHICRNVVKVSYQYLGGRFLIIGILAVLHSTGLMIIGIENAIFFGVLSGLLDLIPYIGVIIGAGLPLLMAILTEESTWPIFAIMGMFTFTQLLENYFLTPKILGSSIKINPLFILIVIFIGGYLWGLAGMILFIPLLGMAKVLFDNVEGLKPIGYLIADPESRGEKIE
ncbi:MAG: AI-2E family transporter [Cytophagaceae bacterium]